MAAAPLQRFLRRFLAPAEDPRRAFPAATALRAELLDGLREPLGRLREAHERLAARSAELRVRQAELPAGQLREVVAAELAAVTAQIDELDGTARRLMLDGQRLAVRIAAQTAQEQLVGARYDAAGARVRIAEALAGLDDTFRCAELGDAEARVAELEARAEAIDSLLADGTL